MKPLFESENIESALNIISSKVGGKNNKAKEASIEAVKQTFDILPRNIFDIETDDVKIQKLFFYLTDPKKLEYIEEYTKIEATSLEKIIDEDKPEVGAIKIEKGSKEYTDSFSLAALLLTRLEKLYKIYSEGIKNIEVDKEKHLLSSLKSMEIVLNLVPVLGKGSKGKITKIGGIDSNIDNSSFEVEVNDELIILPKSDISKILKRLPKNNNLRYRSDGKHLSRMNNITETSAESIRKWYSWASKTFEKTINGVENIKEDEATIKIDNIRNFSEKVGGNLTLNLVIDYKGKETNVESRLKERESKFSVTKELKNKRKLFSNIRTILSNAELPAFDDSNIQRQGDYFRLFNTLREEKADWMDTILLKDVFKRDTSKFNEFKHHVSNESTEEVEQLNYLAACELWIIKFIESDYLGEFNQRETKSYTSAIQSIVLDKSKDIKNSYLSKGFNLGNFRSVQINPEISLPLYKKVKLAISKEDIRKENPFMNIISGIGSIASGLIGTHNINTAALANAKQNNQLNKKIFSGISNIVKGMVGAVGGKEAAKKYEKGVKKLTKNRLARALGTTTIGQNEEPVKEDMISPMDSPSYSGPQQSLHQTGPQMGGGFDDPYALIGPPKNNPYSKKNKKKKGKSKKSISPKSNRVLSFADFIKISKLT